MAHGPTKPKALAHGMVSDSSQPVLDGNQEPLSLTNDGRLRVASVPARTGVPFFAPSEEQMWGNLRTEYTFSGSPWGGW